MNTNGTGVEGLELIVVVAVGVLAMGWLSRRTGLSEPLLLLGVGCLAAREDLVGLGDTDKFSSPAWVSGIAFERGEFRNFALCKQVYGEVRSRWGLGAQAAQHVIKKTCDAYTTLKANLRAGNVGRPGSRRYRKASEKPIVFRPQGAQPYSTPIRWSFSVSTWGS